MTKVIAAVCAGAISVALAPAAAGCAADEEQTAISLRSVVGGTVSGPTTASYDGRAALEPRPVAISVSPPKQTPRTVESVTPEIVERTDTPATELRAFAGGNEADDLGLFLNSLVNKGTAAWIAEPHVASSGERVLTTWNHGAALSSDGGNSFTLVSASELAQGPGGYCCDQVVLYDPARDLWLWFVQGDNDEDEHNLVRVGVARGDEAFDSRSFTNWTFAAESFGTLLTETDPSLDLSTTSLDFPNVALTTEHFFLAINVYDETGLYRNTVVMRIGLDGLEAGTADLDWRYVVSKHGTAQLVDGASDTMYFAQHIDSSTLRVWRWPDGDDNPVGSDVAHSSYTWSPSGYTCPRAGATTGDICKRLKGRFITNDDRVNSGWVTEDEIGFAWNANRDPENGFPFPFVMVVRLDRSSLTLRDEPHVWSPDHAYQYAAFSPNARGEVGGVVIAAGGDRYWTCASLVRDDVSDGAWEARILDVSDADSLADQTGDYLGAVQYEPGGNTWAGTCMTLDGGGRSTDVQVRLYHFGRNSEVD